jgi:hypothetical protein
MTSTVVPAPETDRLVRLTPLGVATCAAYQLVHALEALGAADRAEVLALLAAEVETLDLPF